MPDRGDERGRGGTRTLVTGILAGTEWHPATNPQEATQTARDARDLAVRLRPVLSKLAQAPRGGRRRDLDWLPAVEQLAVDAQYFASWWLPRLEGKSAQSWPSWSADGYADWVKRLDAQRLRTLEMVQGTAPVARIASVTQLRRGKGATAEAEDESTAMATPVPVPAAEDSVTADEARTAQITPLRGPGAALIDAALIDRAGIDAPGMRVEEFEPGLSADETHISRATPVATDERTGNAESTAPTTSASGADGTQDVPPPVPRTPPNQGPADDPHATHVQHVAADGTRLDFTEIAQEASDAALPRVPRTPPNQGPADDDANATHIQRVPADSEALDVDEIAQEASDDASEDASEDAFADPGVGADIVPLSRNPRPPIVSLVEDRGAPRVPRTPPNSGPAGDSLSDDANTTHISRAPAAPAAFKADEATRPLFRDEPKAAAAVLTAAPVAAVADADAGHDEFENFQPGSDLPPPVFPMTEPAEPVDRGRIVRYALAAVVLAAACVLVFYAVTQKGSGDKVAGGPATTSSTGSAGGSPSSASSGAVTAPTATGSPDVSSTASTPSSSKPSKPSSSSGAPSTSPKSSASHTSAAPPPPPQSTTHQPSGGGGVSSLSVVSLAPDQTGSFTYVADVHVTTSGTGTVTVTVTFAGTSSSDSPGSAGSSSQSFALSGKTSYDITAQADVHAMCQPRSPYIDAVASGGGQSSVAYASSPC
jgi:hypothetical protein